MDLSRVSKDITFTTTMLRSNLYDENDESIIVKSTTSFNYAVNKSYTSGKSFVFKTKTPLRYHWV